MTPSLSLSKRSLYSWARQEYTRYRNTPSTHHIWSRNGMTPTATKWLQIQKCHHHSDPQCSSQGTRPRNTTIPVFLGFSRVDDKDSIRDGDACLCDVGGQHNLPHSPRGHCEHPTLVLRRQHRVKGKDLVSAITPTGESWIGYTCTHTHARMHARTHTCTHTHTHTHMHMHAHTPGLLKTPKMGVFAPYTPKSRLWIANRVCFLRLSNAVWVWEWALSIYHRAWGVFVVVVVVDFVFCFCFS